MSVFVKKSTASNVTIGYIDTSVTFVGGAITYTYATNTITVSQSANASVSGEAVSYGNGWYRLIIKYTSAALVTFNYQYISAGGSFIYGAQFETSAAYATSYIPTLGASVTRVADAASKTGISSLIGQTEGTFFVEIDLKNAPINDSYVFLRNAGVTNYLGLRIQAANLRFESVDSGVLQTAINYTINTAQTVKVAMAYKLNDFVMYVNGTQVGTDTSATVPTCDILDLNFNAPTANAFGIAQSLLFKTRLTNSQLAELTSL
jgi:hypothetical protein